MGFAMMLNLDRAARRCTDNPPVNLSATNTPTVCIGYEMKWSPTLDITSALKSVDLAIWSANAETPAPGGFLRMISDHVACVAPACPH